MNIGILILVLYLPFQRSTKSITIENLSFPLTSFLSLCIISILEISSYSADFRSKLFPSKLLSFAILSPSCFHFAFPSAGSKGEEEDKKVTIDFTIDRQSLFPRRFPKTPQRNFSIPKDEKAEEEDEKRKFLAKSFRRNAMITILAQSKKTDDVALSRSESSKQWHVFANGITFIKREARMNSQVRASVANQLKKKESERRNKPAAVDAIDMEILPMRCFLASNPTPSLLAQCSCNFPLRLLTD